MKKNYISPEAEMTKFEEIEEIMVDSSMGVWEGEIPGDWQ